MGPWRRTDFTRWKPCNASSSDAKEARPASKPSSVCNRARSWQALHQGRFSKTLLDAALALVPAHAPGDLPTLTAKSNDAALFLVEYQDGLKAAVAMPNGWVHEGDGGAFCFAGRIKGQDKPAA